jgi:hypothetical protein
MRYVVSVLLVATMVFLAAYFWKARDFAGTKPEVATPPAIGDGDTSPASTPDETVKEPLARRQAQQPGSSDNTPIPSTSEVPLRDSQKRTQSHPSAAAHTVPAAVAINQWLSDPGDSAMGNPLAAPHQVFQGEHVDGQWSSAATQQLKDHLEDSLATKFEFPVIECRQDMCEVQAATVAPGPNDDVAEFQRIFYDMPTQPWWQSLGFGGPTFAVKSSGDGRELIVCFIARQST